MMFTVSACFYISKQVTCEDVLRHDVDLHLQWVLGGVCDLSRDVGDLADEHRAQELRLLHPSQSCHAAVLEKRNSKPQSFHICHAQIHDKR